MTAAAALLKAVWWIAAAVLGFALGVTFIFLVLLAVAL